MIMNFGKQWDNKFSLADQVLEVVNSLRYLGHIIRSDQSDDDDDDVLRQCCKSYAQTYVDA